MLKNVALQLLVVLSDRDVWGSVFGAVKRVDELRIATSLYVSAWYDELSKL